MKRLHVFAMLIMACFWVLSGVVQAQTNYYNIGNLVWNDLNKNGVQDPGEPGIPNVEVWLYSCGATTGTISSSSVSFIDHLTPIKKTYTDLNGNYSFGGLGCGKYFIKVIVPDGWAISPMFKGTSDEKDSDIFPYLGFTGIIELTENQTPNDRLSEDAGLFKIQEADLVTIGDMVFNDCNHNGIQDCDEKGIAGVRVKLYACDFIPGDGEGDLSRSALRRQCRGLFLEEVVTDLNGHYEFGELLPGEYCIEVCLPHGFRTIPRPNCPDVCNPDFETNTTGCMMFTACTKNLDIDFAICNTVDNCKLAGVGDLVWNDEDLDGIQEMNESVMPNVTLTLYAACPHDSVQGLHDVAALGHCNCTPLKVGSVKTDANGKYLFANLIPGLYYIKVTPPFAYVVSATNTDNPFEGCNDNDFWRYYDGTTKVINRTGTFWLSAGDPNLCVDAGLRFDPTQVATIGDFVWRDDDADGIQDDREIGVPDVTINLYECTVNCGTPACGKLVATTKTDANGAYHFDNVDASKDYCLGIVVPPCFVLTTKGVGADAVNSDFAPDTKHTVCYNIVGGQNYLDIDAGLVPSITDPGMVGDFVWNDANQNGIQDCGEKGICGVKVELHAADGGATVATTTTDENGRYLFTNVPTEATYFVKFILPAQYEFTAQNQGNADDLDSDPCPEKWITANFTLGSGQNNMIVDAGMYTASCTISNYVWDDKDGDGQKNGDETGMAGVTVELYSCASNALVQSVKTDASGFYTFSNVLADSYHLNVIAPSGYVLGKSVKSSDDGVNAETYACIDINRETSFAPTALVAYVGVDSRTGTPTTFALRQNFPNPFNPSTTINYDIPAAGQYVMKVYNMLGQEVATLVNGELGAGYHSVIFDASRLTSGVYIYRLTGNNVVMTKKMMLNK